SGRPAPAASLEGVGARRSRWTFACERHRGDRQASEDPALPHRPILLLGTDPSVTRRGARTAPRTNALDHHLRYHGTPPWQERHGWSIVGRRVLVQPGR